MQIRRKREAEERHCQIAQTIRYIPRGLLIAINLGGLSLLYFSLSFCEVQYDDNSGNLNRLQSGKVLRKWVNQRLVIYIVLRSIARHFVHHCNYKLVHTPSVQSEKYIFFRFCKPMTIKNPHCPPTNAIAPPFYCYTI